jgi:hypothetical protein
VITFMVSEALEVTEEDAVESLVPQVADELESAGAEVWGEDGDYLKGVYERAAERWQAMTAEDRAGVMQKMEQEREVATAFVAPLALVFDFGIVGTLCSILACGTAWKCGSANLERTLLSQGKASSPEEAAALAAHLRAGGTSEDWSFGQPAPAAEAFGALRGMPAKPPGAQQAARPEAKAPAQAPGQARRVA